MYGALTSWDHFQSPMSTSSFWQIHKLRTLASILTHRLQIVVIDNIRNEALFVLQLHGVERAAVAIDADEERVLGDYFVHGVGLKRRRVERLKSEGAGRVSLQLFNC